MKAISIRQPWAHLIIHGFEGVYKNVENRDWRTKYRGRIFIHASKTSRRGEHSAAESVLENISGLPFEAFEGLEFGGIIGSVEIVDCVDKSDSPWFFGKYGFVLRGPKPMKFIPLRGQLGIFNVDDELVKEND